MTCKYCATDSPIYARGELCCCVRFIMRDCHGTPEQIREMRTRTAELYQERYGFTRDEMLAERERQNGMRK